MSQNELHIVLGGAGFIGFNLVTEMVKLKRRVLLIDDQSNSVKSYLINELLKNELVNFIQTDINSISANNIQQIVKVSKNYKSVFFWHLAANSDIKASIDNSNLDLDKTLKTTLSAINLCKHIKNVTFLFSSSSAVYGFQSGKTLSEDEDRLIPTSNYGITKLASELFLRNSVGFEFTKLIIFRFPNVLGVPSTHGVVHDWIIKANENNSVNVLGDGSQQKQYLNVNTLVNCMLFLFKKIDVDFEIINIGPSDEGVSVKELMMIFTKYWPYDIDVSYEQNNTGWRGDVNRYRMDVSKIFKMGFTEEIKSIVEVEKSISEMIRSLKF
jgi:UDP-glucose 4-epimerase